MTPLHYIVVFFAQHPRTHATADEIEKEFGDVKSELAHLVSLRILSVHGFDRSRYWFNKEDFIGGRKKRPTRSWYSAEKKIMAVLARKAARRAA